MEEISKGLAKLGNFVAETLLQTQMFPSLASVAEANFASWKQGNVSESSQKHFTDANFASQTQILLPRLMFPSLATQGNMSGKNVSAIMFPSLAKPYSVTIQMKATEQ